MARTFALCCIALLFMASFVHAKPVADPVCGDGKINQESEQCDRRAGVPKGYLCNDECILERDPVKILRDCKKAVREGTLVGQITAEGEASITNNDNQQYDITLVAYAMYSKKPRDTVYFESLTQQLASGKTALFSIDVPSCTYQLWLICGEPITDKKPRYGARAIDVIFPASQDFCAPE